MAPASNEEQFKFLISCIRYSNNGKVDFGNVAKECAIVTKGAAAKRYERMMRAHGIAPNAASIKPAPSRVMKSERRKSSASSKKKRKVDAFNQDNVAADDDETFANVKPEGADTKEHLQVKEEGETPLSMGDATNLVQYYDTASQYEGELGGEQEYYGSEQDDNTIGYSTPLSSYGLQDQQAYGFDTAYGSGGMENDPRSTLQGNQNHSNLPPMVLWPVGNHGRSDSPVVLE